MESTDGSLSNFPFEVCSPLYRAPLILVADWPGDLFWPQGCVSMYRFQHSPCNRYPFFPIKLPHFPREGWYQESGHPRIDRPDYVLLEGL
jgi:hypothetical protein